MNVQLPNPTCVVKVGDGRGFIVRYSARRQVLNNWFYFSYPVIVTAAHCLPKLPPAHAGSYGQERFYKNFVCSLKKDSERISVACLFADPVADIAVLGCPDEQERSDEAEAYSQFVTARPALRITTPDSGMGWLLSLDGDWIQTDLKFVLGEQKAALWTGPTVGGMSGSPVLNNGGKAIGAVVAGHEGAEQSETGHGPQPILMDDLPARFLRNRR